MDTLPLELVIAIIEQLSLLDIGILRQTCRAMASIGLSVSRTRLVRLLRRFMLPYGSLDKLDLLNVYISGTGAMLLAAGDSCMHIHELDLFVATDQGAALAQLDELIEAAGYIKDSAPAIPHYLVPSCSYPVGVIGYTRSLSPSQPNMRISIVVTGIPVVAYVCQQTYGLHRMNWIIHGTLISRHPHNTRRRLIELSDWHGNSDDESVLPSIAADQRHGFVFKGMVSAYQHLRALKRQGAFKHPIALTMLISYMIHIESIYSVYPDSLSGISDITRILADGLALDVSTATTGELLFGARDSTVAV